MNFKKVLIGTMIASQVVTAQMAQAFTVSVDTNFLSGLTGNSELFVGHEEITRQALVIVSRLFAEMEKSPNKADAAIVKELRTLGLLDIINLNQHRKDIVSGANSQNAIIQGNYATDMPGKDKKYPNLNELSGGAYRVENSPIANKIMAGVPAYKALLGRKFILPKGAKSMVSLSQLNDQQAFFIKVLFEAVIYNRLEQTQVARRADPKRQDEISKTEKASRGDLVRELEKIAVAWGGDWHNNPEGQITHFLRNYINTTDKKTVTYGLATASGTCSMGRSILIALVKNSLSYLPVLVKGAGHELSAVREQSKAIAFQMMFLLGHATHMLQDSFSGEHTRRALSGMARGAYSDIEASVKSKLFARAKILSETGKPAGAGAIVEAEKNNDILDICYYGAEQEAGLGAKGKDVCYHKYLAPDLKTMKVLNQSTMKGDFGDSIWTYGEGRDDNGNTIGSKFFGLFRTESKQNESEGLEKARLGNLFNKTTAVWAGSTAGLGERVDQRAPRSSEPEGIERWALINHNARLARTASAKLLFSVFKYIGQIAPGFRKAKVSDEKLQEFITFDDGVDISLMENVFAPGAFPADAADLKRLSIDWNAFKTAQVIDTDKEGKQFAAPIISIGKIMPLGAFRCEQIQ